MTRCHLTTSACFAYYIFACKGVVLVTVFAERLIFRLGVTIASAEAPLVTDLQDRAVEGGALTCVVWKHGATLPSRPIRHGRLWCGSRGTLSRGSVRSLIARITQRLTPLMPPCASYPVSNQTECPLPLLDCLQSHMHTPSLHLPTRLQAPSNELPVA
jgi:hypothetical protein